MAHTILFNKAKNLDKDVFYSLINKFIEYMNYSLTEKLVIECRGEDYEKQNEFVTTIGQTNLNVISVPTGSAYKIPRTNKNTYLIQKLDRQMVTERMLDRVLHTYLLLTIDVDTCSIISMSTKSNGYQSTINTYDRMIKEAMGNGELKLLSIEESTSVSNPHHFNSTYDENNNQLNFDKFNGLIRDIISLLSINSLSGLVIRCNIDTDEELHGFVQGMVGLHGNVITTLPDITYNCTSLDMIKGRHNVLIIPEYVNLNTIDDEQLKCRFSNKPVLTIEVSTRSILSLRNDSVGNLILIKQIDHLIQSRLNHTFTLNSLKPIPHLDIEHKGKDLPRLIFSEQLNDHSSSESIGNLEALQSALKLRRYQNSLIIDKRADSNLLLARKVQSLSISFVNGKLTKEELIIELDKLK